MINYARMLQIAFEERTKMLQITDALREIALDRPKQQERRMET